jgi:hypothetical protein
MQAEELPALGQYRALGHSRYLGVLFSSEKIRWDPTVLASFPLVIWCFGCVPAAARSIFSTAPRSLSLPPSSLRPLQTFFSSPTHPCHQDHISGLAADAGMTGAQRRGYGRCQPSRQDQNASVHIPRERKDCNSLSEDNSCLVCLPCLGVHGFCICLIGGFVSLVVLFVWYTVK